MGKIGFVRHGVTHWNKEGRAQGSSDIPLDKEGVEQARLLAKRLEIGEWDVLYSSDLLRAKQTAEFLSDKLETELHLDSRLRERSSGLIEGTTEDERVQKWGLDWRGLDIGFETHDSIISRGLSFIDEISDKHHDQNVLLISHGSFLKRLLKVLLPESSIDEPLQNTSLTSLVKRVNGWDCDLYNCINHLIKSDSLKI